MEASNNKKGVSPEAQALTKKYRDRFVEFVKKEGLSEVSKRTGCNYQALRNSVVEGYNPSPDTVFQVKLGYGEEFDEVYVFTGKRIGSQEINSQYENKKDRPETVSKVLEDTVSSLREKIYERERQISDLKKDKKFLQSMIKSLQATGSREGLDVVLHEFNDDFITKFVYAYKPEKHDPKVTLIVLGDSTDIIDNFRDKLRPFAGQMDTDDYSLIMSLTRPGSDLYELAKFNFDVKKFIDSKINERDPMDDGEVDPTTEIQHDAQYTVEEAKSSILELYRIVNELI